MTIALFNVLDNESFFAELNRLFNGAAPPGPNASPAMAYLAFSSPGTYTSFSSLHTFVILNGTHRIEVHEDKEKDLVNATFEPGVNKENVSVDVRNSLLNVWGGSKFASDRDEHRYVVRERCFDRFSRSLLVSEGIKVSVGAGFEGVRTYSG